jgi:hypothetical protein
MLIMRIVNREEGSATSRDILEQDPSVGGGSHGFGRGSKGGDRVR